MSGHRVVRALCVRQPWANRIASGEKSIETRTWATRYRGEIMICSSLNPPRPEPVGSAVALAELVECRPMMTPADWAAACCDPYLGAYGWVLANVRAVRPFRIAGHLGIFHLEIPDPVEYQEAVREGRQLLL